MGEPGFYAEWAASDDPARRAHVAAARAMRAAAPADFPPLTRQAANLAGAVGRFVASGLKRATPAEQAGRLAICGGCDRFRDGKCLECGCVTAWKARLQSEHCPIGKW